MNCQAAREYLSALLRGIADAAGPIEIHARQVEKGVELSRVQAIGMGPLDDRRIPEDKKRRVAVTLMADSPSRPVTRREVGE